MNLVSFAIVSEVGVPVGVKVKLSLAVGDLTEVGNTFKCFACDITDSLNEELSINISLPSMFA